MRQIYIPYWDWECYQNGMWSKENSNNLELLEVAIKFTSDHIEYGKAMKEVVLKWDNTMMNHLSNPSINKKAFIGHCACSYKLKLPEVVVRKAWKHLSPIQQDLANKEAGKAYLIWKREQEKKSIITSKNGKADAIHKAYQIPFQ